MFSCNIFSCVNCFGKVINAHPSLLTTIQSRVINLSCDVKYYYLFSFCPVGGKATPLKLFRYLGVHIKCFCGRKKAIMVNFG